MTKQQKWMLQEALEALVGADNGTKNRYVAANDYATAKIEDVLALEEGEADERPITAEDILGIGAKK